MCRNDDCNKLWTFDVMMMMWNGEVVEPTARFLEIETDVSYFYFLDILDIFETVGNTPIVLTKIHFVVLTLNNIWRRWSMVVIFFLCVWLLYICAHV